MRKIIKTRVSCFHGPQKPIEITDPEEIEEIIKTKDRYHKLFTSYTYYRLYEDDVLIDEWRGGSNLDETKDILRDRQIADPHENDGLIAKLIAKLRDLWKSL